MTISEIINTNHTTDFSFEVLPPLKGTGTQSLFHTIDTLREYQPKYINITTHRSEYVYTQLPDGTFQRNNVRRRPGTIAVASTIMQKYDIKVVPHVVCSGFTREEIEYMLLDLQFLGIEHLLLLRGDKAKDEPRFLPTPGGHAHTTELIQQVEKFNNGQFIDGKPIKHPLTPFSYGVACYPEKHEEAPNLDFDIQVLKMKQTLGANYAVTQMFFDNEKYFTFLAKARQEGITIPIIPAIKPLNKLSQIHVVPQTFHLDLPTELTSQLALCQNDNDVAQVGTEWATHQCRQLIAHQVPCIHFYTMGAVSSIEQIAKAIF